MLPVSPPPPPLSKEEFSKRYRDGMTIYEVDPKLAEYCQNIKGQYLFENCVLIIGIIVLLAICLIKVLER